MIPTESQARGERRPMWSASKGKTNPAFSTGAFGQTPMAGTYFDENLDKALHKDSVGYKMETDFPLSPFGTMKRYPVPASVDRTRWQNLERENYNKQYGPGASSSRPAFPSSESDRRRVLAKKIAARITQPREGGKHNAS